MRARGFTLLELIVVFLIVSVLLGILIPVLTKGRESARRTACASNLNSIGKAMFMYADVPSNGEHFPAYHATATGGALPMPSLNLLYRGYIADPKVLSCPSAPVPASALSAITPTVGDQLSIGGTFLSAQSCSYGYDPDHTIYDSVATILADRKGGLQNSDNHGTNAGQNVLIGAGTVEFHDSPFAHLGSSATENLHDPDIYSPGNIRDKRGEWSEYPGLRSHIRQ